MNTSGKFSDEHLNALVDGQLGAGEAGACCAFETIKQTVLVALGLEFADEPCACVGESFVINVHGVLGGEQKAEAKGAGLFQHAQERAF